MCIHGSKTLVNRQRFNGNGWKWADCWRIHSNWIRRRVGVHTLMNISRNFKMKWSGESSLLQKKNIQQFLWESGHGGEANSGGCSFSAIIWPLFSLLGHRWGLIVWRPSSCYSSEQFTVKLLFICQTKGRSEKQKRRAGGKSGHSSAVWGPCQILIPLQSLKSLGIYLQIEFLSVSSHFTLLFQQSSCFWLFPSDLLFPAERRFMRNVHRQLVAPAGAFHSASSEQLPSSCAKFIEYIDLEWIKLNSFPSLYFFYLFFFPSGTKSPSISINEWSPSSARIPLAHSEQFSSTSAAVYGAAWFEMTKTELQIYITK